MYTEGPTKIFSQETTKSSTSWSLPVLVEKMYESFEIDESPSHVACTQEASNNIDVVWDWNSPQAKQRPRQIKKRITAVQSPKIPLKRHPSNNHVQNFEKLREELQNLRKEISVPDSEESLVLSPLEETEYKNVNNPILTPATPLHDNCPMQDDDLFNDSANEQLILCSQRIEADLYNTEHFKAPLCTDSVSKVEDIKNTVTKPYQFKKQSCVSNSVKVNDHGSTQDLSNERCKIVDDSFDIMLEEFKLESHEGFTNVHSTSTKQDVKNSSLSFPSTKPENQHQISRQKSTGKVEFYRTQSFESTFEHTKEIIPRNKLDEIDRKRREALAKLELKRKQCHTDSPLKCTSEEIEQKRLQALAKREAKRQQEIIERKRQEALKRLELNRKKNATIVKSSLTKRL